MGGVIGSTFVPTAPIENVYVNLIIITHSSISPARRYFVLFVIVYGPHFYLSSRIFHFSSCHSIFSFVTSVAPTSLSPNCDNNTLPKTTFESAITYHSRAQLITLSCKHTNYVFMCFMFLKSHLMDFK